MEALSIRVAEDPSKAPSYLGGDFVGAKLTEAVIVLKGTTKGNPTVDLVFEVKDANGVTTDLAVAMTTGSILKALARLIEDSERK